MDPTGWDVILLRQAERDLAKGPTSLRQRVVDALDGLTSDPWTGDIEKLTSQRERFRLRVGEWRVLFTRDRANRRIFVTAVRPRGSAYRG